MFSHDSSLVLTSNSTAWSLGQDGQDRLGLCLPSLGDLALGPTRGDTVACV